MTQIDEQIDNILLEHIVLATDNGQPYIKSTDTAVEAIKALISNQVAKARIEELERTMPHTDGMRHYNTVVARIEELKRSKE